MIDRPEIDRRVHVIERNAHKLDELARLDTSQFVADERLPVCAERYLQVACEACIEIGLLLISGLRLKRPASYDDIAEILTGAGFVPVEYAPHIERIVRLRDLLIHSYRGIEPHALHNQLSPWVIELRFFASQAIGFVKRKE